MERSDQLYVLLCDGLPVFYGMFMDCLKLRDSLMDVDGMDCFTFSLRKDGSYAKSSAPPY